MRNALPGGLDWPHWASLEIWLWLCVLCLYQYKDHKSRQIWHTGPWSLKSFHLCQKSAISQKKTLREFSGRTFSHSAGEVCRECRCVTTCDHMRRTATAEPGRSATLFLDSLIIVISRRLAVRLLRSIRHGFHRCLHSAKGRSGDKGKKRRWAERSNLLFPPGCWIQNESADGWKRKVGAPAAGKCASLISWHKERISFFFCYFLEIKILGCSPLCCKFDNVLVYAL